MTPLPAKILPIKLMKEKTNFSSVDNDNDNEVLIIHNVDVDVVAVAAAAVVVVVVAVALKARNPLFSSVPSSV